MPIISLLESRLELLCGGGRSVQIVAFNQNRHLWKYSQHLYLREVILYHLVYHWQYEQNLLHKHAFPLVFVFDSYSSPEFARFCYVYLPVFALVAKPQYSALIVEENNYLLTYLLLYLTALEIPCVSTSEVTFSSNAMYGFTIDIPRNVQQYIVQRFRTESPVAAPSKLEELAKPQANKFIETVDKPLDTVFGNLISNELVIEKYNVDLNNVRNGGKPTSNNLDKISLRRCLAVYALIMMFRDKKGKNITTQV